MALAAALFSLLCLPRLSAAKAALASKANIRALECGGWDNGHTACLDFKKVASGLLVQDKDFGKITAAYIKVVSKRQPTEQELADLLFAWKVAKFVKSNAIVLAAGTRTVGIGAGQMSRVDAVMIAKSKSSKLKPGCCLASDAFFPKADAISWADKAGAKAIIQPGGSIADGDIIAACDKYKIAMVTTGIRHFKH